MDWTSSIVTGFRAVAGTVFPPLKKRYFDQPEISLQLDWRHATKQIKGLSSKNNFSEPINESAAVFQYQLKWQYTLTLQNNSEHTACSMQLIAPEQNFTFSIYPAIGFLKQLTPSAEEVYEVRFSAFFVGTGAEADQKLSGHPDLLASEVFILKYTNVKGTKFYTLFEATKGQHKRNRFFRNFTKTK